MTITQYILLIGAIVTSLTAIGIATKKLLFLVKRFIHFLDDYFGEEARPGFEGRPGMQERLHKMEDELACISFEMRPNHGTSIKDAINRIEKRLDALEQK